MRATLRGVTLSLLMLLTYSVSAASAATDSSAFARQMESKALASYVEKVARKLVEAGSKQYFFLKTQPQIEDQILSAHHYPWLVREAEVLLHIDTSYRLKNNASQRVNGISVSELEKVADGWRCIVTLYGGNTGCESMRCYFSYVEKEWKVTKIVEDPELPVS